MEAYHHFDNNNNNDAHLPPGFRFHPTDEELITYYLIKKVLDGTFQGRAIAEVDLNKCEPWELPEKAKMGEKEWYFFSLRDRKYPTGLRTNRATEAGYWKATGKDREIYSSKTCALVGMKKTLVFYRGRAPKGEKSNWVMHEYRLEGKFAYHYLSRSSKDEWVISRVFMKSCAGTTATAVGVSSGKKTRLNTGISLYPDVSSPSSASLPALLDSSPYAAAADRESGSYEGGGDTTGTTQHVPCFSTMAAAAANMNNPHHQFDFHPPPPAVGLSDPERFTRHNNNNNSGYLGGVSAFPSLRSIQENLHQFPFFFSSVAPFPMHGGSSNHGGVDAGVNWPAPSDQKVVNGVSGAGGGRMVVGPTELDCMWTY